MEIPEHILTASRAYLLGLQTVEELILAHGKTSFQTIQLRVVDFVGLAIPGLKSVLASWMTCVRLDGALRLRLHGNNTMPASRVIEVSNLLDRLEKEDPAFMSPSRDEEITSRFLEGLLDWHLFDWHLFT